MMLLWCYFGCIFSGNLEVAERIMAYLLSDEPWRKLYPSEDVQSSAHLERRSIVIDCYFNTSDKGVS